MSSGFIPAGAGNSTSRRFCTGCPPVHPRGCGEQRVAKPSIQSIAGSSPRVRGTAGAQAQATITGRFIPAGAGNSTWPPAHPGSRPVHPRGCGEQFVGLGSLEIMFGSSPRVRGTGQHGHRFHRWLRFIPAGAGNSCTGSGPSTSRSVHPRGCGEQVASTVRVRWPSGSSPRVRGTVLHDDALIGERRFIPAGAGNR